LNELAVHRYSGGGRTTSSLRSGDDMGGGGQRPFPGGARQAAAEVRPEEAAKNGRGNSFDEDRLGCVFIN